MRSRIPIRHGEVWAEDTEGGEPAVVLLHPGWGDSTIWDPLLARLDPSYRVVRYDTRGYGRSPAPTEPFTQLDDLTDVLDLLAVHRAIVVGHSGGGATALGLALARPSSVSSLILVAPGVQDYPWPEQDPYFETFAALFDAGDRDGLRALGLRTWAAADSGPAAVAQIDSAVTALFAQGDQQRPDPPAFDRLDRIPVLADVLVGDRDHPMIRACAEAVAARLPQGRLTPVPGADHLLPLHRPGDLADLIDRHAGSEP